ncbi:MAG: hypothetical protein E7K72_19295 [Roseomonas mucosa]|nr:hypothetical protein [Roseomonas mucosa]
MKCHCGANLGHLSARGEPMIRTRGMIFKAEGVRLLCPKCGDDVPLGPELESALRRRLLAFPKQKPTRTNPPSADSGTKKPA